MIFITRKAEFSSAHYYWNDSWSPEENLRVFGKCANRNGHGHNYTVEVTVSGPVDEQTGMVCNLTDLVSFIEREVLSRYGHENLNMLPEFAQEVPTTENLCIRIYEIVHRGFRFAHLERVRLEETMMNSFEYSGES